MDMVIHTGAYKDGYDAFCDDETIDRNPFPINSVEWRDWRSGYFDAEIRER